MILRAVSFLSAALLVLPALAVAQGLDPHEAQTLRTYCKADVERLCPNVEPGGGRIKECLMAQKESMSVGCAKALQELKKEMKQK
ncbi:Cysteine rich repeat-containing protein [Methylomagnum ishizawai]|uniref:Cysteine rich repeat-containing protein n=1 Tax=Methylomagnum ishizawai TaxID=1760988 RepID=A0A1Y6D006_9GAMM|nr:cysteine rich repeat-containing protein [Methylomagnum ishizawai]SMF95896.1 Cysteine rich repeat-containing protein [Methylomagnum ishizawai]